MRHLFNSCLGLLALSLSFAVTRPADAQIVSADVGKNLEYQQTGASTVVPFNGGTNANFFGRTFFTTPSDFDGGYMTAPGGSTYTFNTSGLLDCCGHYGRAYQTTYETPAAINAAFPNGTYSLTATNSGLGTSQTLSIPYTDIFTADIPTLTATSFMALQGVNPYVGLTLNFNAFTPNPGATAGQQFFTIYDYTTSMTVVNDFGLPNTNTSVYIPADTFSAGNSYVFELIFDDYVFSYQPSYDGNGAFVSYLPATARSDVRTLGYFSAAVPEPSTWAMLVAGFAGVGLAGLRQARRTQAVSRA